MNEKTKIESENRNCISSPVENFVMPLISVYYRSHPTEANPSPIYVLFGKQPYSRLIRLGCNNFIAARKMTNKEYEENKNNYRCLHIRYNCWEALIDDEQQISNDKEFIIKLIKAKARYSFASNKKWKPKTVQYDLMLSEA